MRRCKNKISGEVCEYFVYGEDIVPIWFSDIGLTHPGTSVVKDGNIVVFCGSGVFDKEYSILVDYVDSGGVPSQYCDTSKFVPIGTMDGDVPVNDGGGESPPATEDILEKGREYVESLNRRIDELKYTGICKEKGTSNLHEYKILDNELFCVYMVRFSKDCFFIKTRFDELFDIVKEPDIDTHPATYVDASFIGDTLEHVGRKCRLNDSVETYDYFIYGRDEIPVWFDFSKLREYDKVFLENSKYGIYVVNKFINDQRPYVILNRLDFNKLYIDYAPAEDGSISESKIDTVNDVVFPPPINNTREGPRFCRCKINHSNVREYFIYGVDKVPKWFNEWSKIKGFHKYIIKNSPCENFYISEELFMENLEDCMSDGTVSSGIERKEDVSCYIGSCKKSAAARFCRCRNDHSVVHEYFVYGVNAAPAWFKGTAFKKGTYVIKRGDSGSVFIMMDQHDFIRNLEVCGPDGEVDVLSKEQIDDYFKDISVIKNAPISDAVAAGTKVHTDNWQQENNTMKCRYNHLHSYECEYFIYGYTVHPNWYLDFAKLYPEKINIPKQGTYVVKTGTNNLDFYDKKRFSILFEAMDNDGIWPSDKVTSDFFSYIKSTVFNNEVDVKKSDVSDIDRAELWFNNLHPEVFRHIVLRSIDSDGIVDMLKLYKSETNN